RDGEWVRRGLDQLVVPLTVRDAVLERVHRLGPDARAVLDAAAVLADPAAEPAPAAVGGVPADRVRAGLARALGAPLPATDRGGLASYRHVLAARAVYQAIPDPGRRDLHQRAAAALAGELPSRLARHYREAGDQQRWRSYADRAAGAALAIGDEATAVV